MPINHAIILLSHNYSDKDGEGKEDRVIRGEKNPKIRVLNCFDWDI